MIQSLERRFSPEQLANAIYVADSAFVTKMNLQSQRKGHPHLRFLSRLPENYKLAKELKEKAWHKGKWQEIGSLSEAKDAATYRISPLKATLYGQTYRFLFVHSSKLDGRKKKSIQSQLDKEYERWTKDCQKLEKQVFACQTDAEKLTDEDMLKGYKAQQMVENRFCFLKNPYFVGSIYLSKPERVEAFAYIMMISVMIYSLFEYLIRREMAKEKEPLELMGGRASFRPTGEAVLEILDTVQIVQMEQNGQTIRLLPENLRSQIERILTLLGMGPAIYTQLKGGNGVENTRV